tara:strand:+ start:1435 stop:2634 length:1200 start_codon:yes stop_codon:yes gene_type:complete
VRVIIIGGGAAGFFTAINIADKHPDWQITILEKTNKLLSKVKISGGGRCNVTNGRTTPSELVPFYPRGGKKLYSLFQEFGTKDMRKWLEKRGVKTNEEADHRVFPTTNNSQTIIDCFQNEVRKHNIRVQMNFGVQNISLEENKWRISSGSGEIFADKIIIATGSSPASWKTLQQIGLEIVKPVPSLFTFNIKDERIQDLMGIAFGNVLVKIVGSKLEESGPLLITHWGFSGPAILKLSAWGARDLAEKNYHFQILINYTGNCSADQVRSNLNSIKSDFPKRKLSNHPMYDIPKRFWERLLECCEITSDIPAGELSKKQLNKLVEELTQGLYSVNGKSTFKEEFVTSGGVKLSEIDLKTFEAKRFPNLYLAGEVLDIDALTGGFNFQACWSAGWVIAQNI